MSYIGNQPISSAFLVDTFSGNGSTVAFTMSVAPANTSSVIVAITGVLQDPSTYSVSGTTLTFSAAPPTGTSNISVRYLGIPASGVTTTAYRTVTNFTATAGQTSFTTPSYTVGYIDVYRNGVRLATTDFTATTGTTVVLNNAATAGDTITTESFYVSSVLNAIQQYNGSSVNQTLTTPTANTLTSGAGSTLQLQTNNGTTALTIDTSQNVGIGTSSPAQKLDISAAGAQIALRSTDTTAARFRGYVNGSESGVIGFLSGGGQYFETVGTERMRLDASGNLGLGVTPSAWSGSYKVFQFGGRGAVWSASDTSALSHNFYNDGTGNKRIAADYATLYQQVVGQHQWLTAGSSTAGSAVSFTQAMTLDASGNLLVGTTSAWGGSPKAEFRQTTNTYWGLSTYNSGTSAGCGALLCRVDSTGVYQIGFYYGASTLVGTITTNGTGTTYGTSSDYRLKEDVKPMVGALNKVQALKPVTYKWKSNGSDGQGFIAHELQEVVPDCVTGEKDAVDEKGNPIYQGIDTSFLVATLTAAIQEQQALIQTLTERITALEGKQS